MSRRIDRFFKSKLDSRKFEFQETYWEEAAKLIAGQERKKKRRGLIILLALMLIVGASVVYLGGKFGGSESPAGDSVVEVLVEPSESSVLAEFSEASVLVEFSEASVLAEFSEASVLAEPSESSARDSEVEMDGAPSAAELPAGDSASDLEQLATGNPKPATGNQPPLHLLARKQPDLSLPYRSLSGLGQSNLFEPKKSKRWALGLTGFGNVSYSEGLGLGREFDWGAGLEFQYRLVSSLSLGIKAQYYRQNEVPEIKNSTYQEYFSFGFQRVDYFQELDYVDYLQIPVSLNWRWRQHMIHGGLVLDYLLGARSTITSVKHATNQAPIHGTEGRSWMPRDDFETIRFSPIFGYRYLIGKRWYIGSEFRYELTPLMKDVENTQTGKMHFGVNFGWRLL